MAAAAPSEMPASPDTMKKMRQRRLRERATFGMLPYRAGFSAGRVWQRQLLGRYRLCGGGVGIGRPRLEAEHRQRLESAADGHDLGETPGAAVRKPQRLADRPCPGRQPQPGQAPLDSAEMLGTGDDLLAGVAALAETDAVNQIEIQHLRDEGF